MPIAYLTVGVPASGKSTWAREIRKEFGTPIVCRDDIRVMQGLKHNENEDLVTTVEYALIEGLVLEGKDFIVADTNINKKFRNKLIKFLHQHGVDVELVLFPISLDEAIVRDAGREAKVGADVIQRMFNDFNGQWQELWDSQKLPVQRYAPYEWDANKDDAIIVDIDGTVARHHNRSPFDETKVIDDLPITPVIDVIKALSDRYAIVFVSGRTDACMNATLDWLAREFGEKWYINASISLYMRKSGDMRPDWVVKNEIYDTHVIPVFNPVMVFDDRDQVVNHIRARGITVAQVAPGRF